MSEQLGSGLAAWRMPVAELDGNSAWLELARWLEPRQVARAARPSYEVVRRQWKRVRQAFVYAAAQVICCRQIIIRISAAHR